MRPLMREDVRYMPCPAGVYLYSGRGMYTLEGTTAHAWLTRLQPFLTGDHTLDEVTGVFPVDQRDTIGRLVRTLHEQGFVVDKQADRPHSLTSAECRTYAEEIGFLRYSLDSAEHRFQCYRQAHVTMLGGGPVLAALLEAGLRSGLRSVRVAGCDPTQVDELRQVVRWASRDGDQHVDIDHPASVTGDALAALVEASDLILQVCGPGEEPGLLTLARDCARAGTVLGQVMVDREEAWLAPVSRHWAESGWRRLGGTRSAPQRDDTGGVTGEQDDWLTSPVPALVAAQLALSCFRHLTGMDDLPRHAGHVTQPVMTSVDLRTLDTRSHNFVAHPAAAALGVPTEREARNAIETYLSGPTVSPKELLTRSRSVVDARCGLISRLDEDELTQLPLWVCRARVSDPYGLLPTGAPPPVVTGHGLGRGNARVSALLEAFAVYGSLAVDRRRFTRGGVDSGADAVWGLELSTGLPRMVPSVAAFPVLDRVAVPYRPPVGAAAGLSWHDAVSAALRQHCELLVAQRLAATELPCPALEEGWWEGEERVSRLLRLLAAARQPVEIHDLGGLHGVPACAVLVNGVTVAIACGTTMTDAVSTGLKRALLHWQARNENQADYAPPTVPQLARRLRAPAVPHWLSDEDTGTTSPLDALRAAGYSPVVVPLDHDREATNVLPYVVQVVLCGD
jgi:hypothetical protein